MTYAEIARLAAELLGSEITVSEITPADVRATLTARGMPDWEAGHFEEMYQLFRDGESEFVTHTVEQITGSPARTVEAFLAEQLAPVAA